MRHYLKAAIASFVVLVSFAAREATSSPHLKYAIYTIAVTIVFLHNRWDLQPDRRISKIRNVDLDTALKAMFAAAYTGLKEGERLPFRANLMMPGFTWYGRAVLRMVYAFEMLPAVDPDYGMEWPRGHGLCWNVYRTGRWAIAGPADQDAKLYRMSRREVELTRHIRAVLSMPIVSAHRKENAPLRRKVVAVLNIDALTDQAAQQLHSYSTEMDTNHEHPLYKLAAYAGFFC